MRNHMAMAAAIGAVVFGGLANGATTKLAWDPGHTPTGAATPAGTGGTGTWTNGSGADWSNGTTDVVYTNSVPATPAYSQVNLAGTTAGAYTVTLGSNISAGTDTAGQNGLTVGLGSPAITYTIDTAGFTLSATTGGALTSVLTSNSLTLTDSATTHGSVIANNLIAANAGTLTIGSGATLTANAGSGGTLAFRSNATNAVVTLAGGTMTLAGSFAIGHSNTTGNNVNLNSGELDLGYGFITDAANNAGGVNFAGAKVKLTRTLTNLLNPTGATGGVVGTKIIFNDVGGGGGAVIDTNGFNAALSQALVHTVGDGTADGGVTKAGVGLFNLSNTANTYTGATTVKGGTLEGSSFGTGAGNAAVFVAPTVTTVSSILQLDTATALASVTNLTLTDLDGLTTATAVLNYVGTDTINTLTYASTTLPVGTYGGLGSGATNIESWLSGTGTLNVTAVPEPALLGIVGIVSVATLRRKRRPN